MQELYPQAWELFLVRDVRAMIAYKTRKGFGDFGREKAGGDAV